LSFEISLDLESHNIPTFLTKLDPDQMDWLLKPPVFIGILLVFDLL